MKHCTSFQRENCDLFSYLIKSTADSVVQIKHI